MVYDMFNVYTEAPTELVNTQIKIHVEIKATGAECEFCNS